MRLPYDLEARGSSLYIADGLRHQVLRLDLRTRKLTVFAGTGVAGSSGDKGPARKARIDEPTELVFDRAGNLYLTDFSQGRVRRISPRGIITTVARVSEAAGLAVHPDGGSLAIASIDGYVRRLDLATGRLELIAGNGTQASGGDGGPAAQAQVNRPHDVAYDTRGDLLVAEAAGVRRIDAATGVIETAVRLPAFKVVPGPAGTLYLLNGGPSGGTVTQVRRERIRAARDRNGAAVTSRGSGADRQGRIPAERRGAGVRRRADQSDGADPGHQAARNRKHDPDDVLALTRLTSSLQERTINRTVNCTVEPCLESSLLKISVLVSDASSMRCATPTRRCTSRSAAG